MERAPGRAGENLLSGFLRTRGEHGPVNFFKKIMNVTLGIAVIAAFGGVLVEQLPPGGLSEVVGSLFSPENILSASPTLR